ncbi:MAG: RNHCP domain-containing protein [Candidatus Cloacimonetes bacterium]|nr:RNHCP domain-containing protein [Candidatus Cloacimonadota bacterium]
MCTARFTHINETFDCGYCGHRVIPHQHGSCRNHCPSCLYSRHLDINPGDRSSDCGGLMPAVKAIIKQMDQVTLIHRCNQCGIEKSNRSAPDDDFEKILEIMRHSN